MIKESGISFNNNLLIRKSTNKIVIHHSDSDKNTTIFDIDRWHKNKGWSGIGYHYVIYPSGAIYRGRPENTIGAHANDGKGNEANSNGIGICLIGQLEQTVPTIMQINSLVWLIRDIWTRYPKINVIGHKDVTPSLCPGKMFPWKTLYETLERKEDVEEDMTKYQTINDIPEWGKETIKKVIAKGNEIGVKVFADENNLNLSEEMLRIFIFHNRLGIYD